MGWHQGLLPAAGARAEPDPLPTTQHLPRVPLSSCSSLGGNFFFFSVDFMSCF